ncbi:hypothetical protein FRB99_009044 [Tulasnella sp. 403]|nr:hypothetical protein FRB99_009044 [Tulasnella sp. 403]
MNPPPTVTTPVPQAFISQGILNGFLNYHPNDDPAPSGYISGSGPHLWHTRNYAVSERKRPGGPIRLHDLPVELLVTIFQMVSVKPYSNPSYGTVEVLQRIASVCTHWWHIILSSPVLWSTILLYDNVPLLLRKSANSPLDIHWVNMFDARGPAHFDEVATHARRWRTVHLHCWDLNNIKRELEEGTPLLERLNLSSSSGVPITTVKATGGSRLRHLYLERVRLEWPTVCISNLTSLTLVDIEDTVQSSRLILKALACCTKLEHLCMDDIRVIGGPVDTGNIQHIIDNEGPLVLPKLKSLNLTRTTETLTSPLLGSLQADRLQRLIFDTCVRNDITSRAAAFLMHPKGGQRHLSCMLGNSGVQGISIELSDDELTAYETAEGTANRSRFNLVLTFTCNASLISTHLSPFNNLGLPLRLSIVGAPGRSTAHHDSAFLREMPMIRHLTLYLDVRRTYDILKFLSAPRASVSGELSWPCPNLKEVCLSSAVETPLLMTMVKELIQSRRGLLNGLPTVDNPMSDFRVCTPDGPVAC